MNDDAPRRSLDVWVGRALFLGAILAVAYLLHGHLALEGVNGHIAALQSTRETLLTLGTDWTPDDHDQVVAARDRLLEVVEARGGLPPVPALVDAEVLQGSRDALLNAAATLPFLDLLLSDAPGARAHLEAYRALREDHPDRPEPPFAQHLLPLVVPFLEGELHETPPLERRQALLLAVSRGV